MEAIFVLFFVRSQSSFSFDARYELEEEVLPTPTVKIRLSKVRYAGSAPYLSGEGLDVTSPCYCVGVIYREKKE